MARILVVDDEQNVRTVLVRILEKKSYDCLEASSVTEAKNLLQQEKIDLVMTDIHMPGESGIELIRYIHQNFTFLPMIVVSIVDDPSFAEEVLNLGVYGYVNKPFNAKQVLIQLYNALLRSKLEKQNREYRNNLEEEVRKRTRKLDKTITRLKAAQKSLKESETKFRSITSYAKDGIVMMDHNGLVTYWNRAAEKIFGYTSEEMIGKELHPIIAPEQYKKAYHTGLEQFKKTGKGGAVGHTVELVALKKGGGIVPVELSISSAKIDHGWAAISIIREISRRKRLEQLSERQAKYATLINNVGRRFSNKLNLHELLHEVVHAIQETFDYYGVMIFLWDDNQQKLVLQEIAGGFKSTFPADMSFELGEGMIGTAARTQKAQLAADVSKHRNYICRAGEKTRSELSVPIVNKGQLVGVLDLQSLQFNTFDDLDVEAMETLCMQITVEIENSILFEKMQNEIEQRKATQKELQASEKKYRTLIETMKDGIGISDLNENLIYVNEAWDNLLGYSSDELIGKNLKELVPEEYFPEVVKQTRLREKGKRSSYELPLLTKDKRVRSFIISASPFLNSDGEIIGTLGILHDITDRKKMEEKLRESNMRTKKILESVKAGIVIIDVQTNEIIELNSTASNLIGVDKSEVIGAPCKKYICSAHDDNCPMQEAGKAVQNVECQIQRNDGEKIPIIKNVVEIEIDEQKMYVESFIDVRKLKETEKALSQAQKLESIGQLAAGIAHEINTPMQYIGDNTKFFQDAFEDINQFIATYNNLKKQANGDGKNDSILQELNEVSREIDLEYLVDEIPHSIRETMEGVKRVTKIVRSMKEFSHPGQKEKSFVDINQALESTITVSRNEWKYVADLETNFDSSLPPVNCLAGEMNQVFLNIIINAAHAIRDVVADSGGEKGKITVETINRDQFVQIRISDTGGGIPEKIRDKIYDPFFTTKEVGKGTGQGLYIAHDIVVNKHNGELKFESKPGEGTTFIIELPIE